MDPTLCFVQTCSNAHTGEKAPMGMFCTHHQKHWTTFYVLRYVNHGHSMHQWDVAYIAAQQPRDVDQIKQLVGSMMTEEEHANAMRNITQHEEMHMSTRS